MEILQRTKQRTNVTVSGSFLKWKNFFSVGPRYAAPSRAAHCGALPLVPLEEILSACRPGGEGGKQTLPQRAFPDVLVSAALFIVIVCAKKPHPAIQE